MGGKGGGGGLELPHFYDFVSGGGGGGRGGRAPTLFVITTFFLPFIFSGYNHEQFFCAFIYYV